MYFSASTPVGVVTGGNTVVGATSMGQSYNLGLDPTAQGQQVYWTVGNPSDQIANLTIVYRYHVDNPPLVIHYTVPAKSRLTIDPRQEAGERLAVAAATLESTVPIAVERTLWSSTQGRSAGWALPALEEAL